MAGISKRYRVGILGNSFIPYLLIGHTLIFGHLLGLI